MFVEIQEKAFLQRHYVTEALGVDFGTTFCCVAYCEKPFTPTVIGPLIPSVVAYTKDRVLVGQEAIDLDGISSVKRHLDPQYAHTFLWDDKSPLQIATDLFRGIKDHIIQHMGRFIPHIVLTVPAYFNEPMRQIIKNAAEQAGFNVIRLISEPTAAALVYNFEQEGIYGVYDFGGGTFDFSLLSMQQGIFRVIATGGDHCLGGDDMDEALGRAFFPKEISLAVLRKKGREIKNTHSECLNKEINHILSPFIEKTLDICLDCLKEARIDVKDLKAVILVGGSTKLALVRERVKSVFKQIPDTALNPDEAVALGAALQAYNLTHQAAFLLLDVTPLSLGIETLGGIIEHLIPRNSPIPASKEAVFTTSQDGQTSIKIHVLQGEQELASSCQSLGSFELTDITALPKGKARIHVLFSIDVDGLLTVSAYEENAGKKQTLIVNPTKNLSYDAINASLENEGKDTITRLWIQKTLQAKEAIDEVRRLLKDNNDTNILLENACDALAKACSGQNFAHLETEWNIFSKIAIPFIERHLTNLLKNAPSENPDFKTIGPN